MKTVEEIEHVIEVFADYIDSIPALDLVLTRKGQYLYLQKGLENEIIESGEWLCKMLLHEIKTDMLVELRQDGDEVIPEEYKPILMKRMRLYMDKLPEYQYLLEQYK